MRLRELISYMSPSIAETANRHMQRLDEMQSKIDSMMINLGTPTLEPLVNTFVYEESDDDIEVTLAYTLSLPFIATIEPTDTLLMADEVISTTPARENDKLIKSSIGCSCLDPWVLDIGKNSFDYHFIPIGEYVVEFLMENVDVAGLPRHLTPPELTPVIDEPTLLVTLSLPCTDVLGDAIEDIDLRLGDPLDTLSTGDGEINFNHTRDIEELECLLAYDPVPVPRVFDDPLGISDSMSRSSETSVLFEELIAEIGLDDSIPIGIDDRYYDSEGDILFFEQLLNEDTSFDVSPALLPTESSSLVLPLPDPRQSSPRPVSYSPKEVMYRYYHPHVTSGDGFDPKIKSVPSKNTRAVIQEYVPIMGVPSKNTRAVIQEYVPIMGVPSKNTRAVLQEYVPIMGVPSKNTRAVLQ
ncbi:hypothetical protein Tco_0233647 [Tanacetum coccineum]